MSSVLVIHHVDLSDLLREFVTAWYFNCVKTSRDVLEICFASVISLCREWSDLDSCIGFLLLFKWFESIIGITEEPETAAMFHDALNLISIANTLARANVAYRILSGISREGAEYACSVLLVGSWLWSHSLSWLVVSLHNAISIWGDLLDVSGNWIYCCESGRVISASQMFRLLSGCTRWPQILKRSVLIYGVSLNTIRDNRCS